MGIFNKKAKLDQELADKMLANIFDQCGAEPNTIPLEELLSYSNYRKDRYKLRKVLLIIIMVIFLLIPLLFIPPRISLLEQASESNPTFVMGVESFLPVTSVKATINGQNIPVYEQATRKYTIQPDITGEMLITVTSVNKQYDQKKIVVNEVDKKAPKAVSSVLKDNQLIVVLTDEGSGVDYDNISATYKDGSKLKIAGIDQASGTVVFNNPKGTVYLIVPDKAGNRLQLQLNI